jgi:hypothetical protein
MDIGPVEYLVIGFPGNRFHGRIVPELARLVEGGTVRILDLVFVSKDDAGNMLVFEYDEVDAVFEEALGYDALDGEVGGFLSDEDAQAAGDLLEPGSSAALLVWEDVWAGPLAAAVRDADGQIIAGGRIAHDSVEAVLSELDAPA